MTDDNELISLTAEIVSAYVGQNNIRPDDIPALIANVHAAILALRSPAQASATAAPEAFVPAVTVRKSLASKDHIISMIDGKSYRTLRRHLSTNDLTPEQYRERYKLPASYPMVAESYSAQRREMAKRIGLGRKPGHKSGKAK